MKQFFSILLFSLIGTHISSAQWITPNANVIEQGSWWCFRKAIELKEKPEDMHVEIAVDSKYWLWINGEMQVFEGGLKRGPNAQDTYVDVFSEIKGLKKGKNTIAILVWYFGKNGFSHNSSGKPGLYFKMKANQQDFFSNTSWKVSQHPAYFVPEGDKPNFRLAESNIGYDANKEQTFYLPDFDDRDWNNAVEVGKPPVLPWNNLVDRPIPQWKDYGLKFYDKLEYVDDKIIAHLPYNAQVTPFLKIKSQSGKLVEIKTDNYNGGGAKNVFAQYITKNGEQSYESFGWMNGHQVIYTIPEGVEVLELKYRETGYDTEFAGTFLSNDPFLNNLWQKAQRTLYITMRDTYMDCPGRERAQWWGDVVNELGESFYALDTASHRLTRKAILELMNWQRADSTIFSPVPAGNWDKELPMQMLASVGYYGFWTYYVGSGDKATITDVYPKVKKYLKVWKTDENGLVIPRKGGWLWGDWGENKDMDLLFNLWYSIALKGFEQMAILCDQPKDALWASQTNDKLKKQFHKEFWNGNHYNSHNYKGLADDRSQALAVVAGIAPESTYPQLREFFKENHRASPYMEKYVLEALCQMGFYEDAILRIKKRYAKMVDSELTTLWEGWGIGSEGYGGGSYNHAWSGGPLTILSQYIAGISPIKPAFDEFEVSPQIELLETLQTQMQTKTGNIALQWKKNNSIVDIVIEVPEDKHALLNVHMGYSVKMLYRTSSIRKEKCAIKFKESDKKLRLGEGIYSIQLVQL